MTETDPLSPSADPKEIERFDALAAEWWDENGPMAPLHKLNPVRLAYIRDRICSHTGRSASGRTPLDGLRVLDIGCGGGLLSEPLARMGAEVTGIDLAPAHIEGAKRHAAESGLAIDYRLASVEDLIAEAERFDLVCAMEVVEHVPDQPAFLKSAASLVKPAAAKWRFGDGDAQPHGAVLRPWHRRCGICAGLAAPRHPQLVPFRPPLGSRARSSPGRARDQRPDRRRPMIRCATVSD